MEVWDLDIGVERNSILRQCQEDRQRLAEDFVCWRPEFKGKPTAVWIEELLDHCGIQIRDCVLPPEQLGLCHVGDKVIFLNSNASVHHKTDLKALRASTIAHEFGHLRLHEHEGEENVFVNFYQTQGLYVHPRALQREREADLYGAFFLVPLAELTAHRVAKKLLRYREKRQDLSSSSLWRDVYCLAKDFRVTPSLMRRCLLEIGWLESHSVAGQIELRLRSDSLL